VPRGTTRDWFDSFRNPASRLQADIEDLEQQQATLADQVSTMPEGELLQRKLITEMHLGLQQTMLAKCNLARLLNGVYPVSVPDQPPTA
jgi:hypothetical protein